MIGAMPRPQSPRGQNFTNLIECIQCISAGLQLHLRGQVSSPNSVGVAADPRRRAGSHSADLVPVVILHLVRRGSWEGGNRRVIT